jgi:hypothetical protein
MLKVAWKINTYDDTTSYKEVKKISINILILILLFFMKDGSMVWNVYLNIVM